MSAEGSGDPVSSGETWVAGAFVAAFGAAGGVTILDRTFVKLRFGPFYIVEILFLAWLLFALLSRHRVLLLRLPRRMPFLWLFAGWGFVLTATVFAGHPEARSGYILTRVEQHVILFLYPLMWMSAGAWLWMVNKAWARLLLWGIIIMSMATALIHDFGFFPVSTGGNLSLGPLSAILLPLILQSIFSPNLPGMQRLFRSGFFLAIGIFVYLPFWRMWLGGSQRTSALLLLIALAAMPFVICRRGDSWIKMCALLLIPFCLFLSGLAVTNIRLVVSQQRSSAAANSDLRMAGARLVPSGPSSSPATINYPTGTAAFSIPNTIQSSTWYQQLKRAFSTSALKRQLLQAVQHGEDMSADPDAPIFQFRVRGVMWESAWTEWRRHPILGVGFLPEVPLHVLSQFLNTGGRETEGSPPISGPHNSYLSVLTRMGLVGVVFFLGLIWMIIRECVRLARQHPDTVPELLLLFIPLNGALYALFNVGFESPHHCMVMWLAAGMLCAP